MTIQLIHNLIALGIEGGRCQTAFVKTSDRRSLWARILAITGGAGMIAGAIDPMEGSLVILPGSLLFAIGGLLGREDRRIVSYRLWVAALITFGVAGLWVSSMFGGFGGDTGRSMWWVLVLLPYPVGWSMGVLGPGSPRWLTALGGLVGLWFVAMSVMVVARTAPNSPMPRAPVIAIGAIGAITVIGCVLRLVRQGFHRA